MQGLNIPAMLDAVREAIADATTPEQTIGCILQEISLNTGSVFSAFWRMDYVHLVMRPAKVWKPTPDSFTRFEVVTRARVIGPGVGIPGRVLHARKPVWVTDVTTDRNFPRAWIAAEEGLHTCFAFPVLFENRVIGVFEFYDMRTMPEDTHLLDALESLGREVGQLFERVRVHEHITGTEEEFHRVANEAVDAIITISEDSTILYANLAAEKLFGYERHELQGQNLSVIIPPELRPAHNNAVARYTLTGQRGITWDGVILPALHRSGERIRVRIAFGEFFHGDRRVFSGYLSPTKEAAPSSEPAGSAR